VAGQFAWERPYRLQDPSQTAGAALILQFRQGAKAAANFDNKT